MLITLLSRVSHRQPWAFTKHLNPCPGNGSRVQLATVPAGLSASSPGEAKPLRDAERGQRGTAWALLCKNS